MHDDLMRNLTTERIESNVARLKHEIAAIESRNNPIEMQLGLPLRRFSLAFWEQVRLQRKPEAADADT